MTVLSSPWLVPLTPEHKGRYRLLCFPYAGGSPFVFRPWIAALGTDFELWSACLPGRANRFREPFAPTIEAVVEAVAREALARGPWTAFFGHSFGGSVAFEVTRALQKAQRQPGLLIISGSRPPHRSFSTDPIHALPEPSFRARLRSYGGTPPEVLANDELMDLLGPVLRADFELAHNYCFREGPLPTVPLVAWGGKADLGVPPAHIAEWSRYSEGPFESRIFEGGHFFLDTQRAELLADIRSRFPAGT